MLETTREAWVVLQRVGYPTPGSPNISHQPLKTGGGSGEGSEEEDRRLEVHASVVEQGEVVVGGNTDVVDKEQDEQVMNVEEESTEEGILQESDRDLVGHEEELVGNEEGWSNTDCSASNDSLFACYSPKSVCWLPF